MIKITEFTVEKINDPFGILTGDRYEYMLELDVPEDDELYTETGVSVKVIFRVEDGNRGIVKYDLMDKATSQPMDFELEDDEYAAIESFCLSNLPEEA
ncbi:DUF6509 family protein [Jeotgalibacillus campisalis]|uniref:Pullulanase n=1 Tax=Jeotgalibacillus campisalis TaxID=220754 RepID=A0A0C2VDT3_9BACL|nr:DUF6509 family protein [Jeotgalibacillus campisalis]KIL47077.1 hypothetical protein KR50_23990 [Jeotgalibacillus campisalis]